MEQFLRLSLYKKYLEMPQETHNIPHSIFLHNYVKILTIKECNFATKDFYFV